MRIAATKARAGTYEELAAEYYDAARHPTCADFRKVSTAILRPLLRALMCEGPGIDVGAGQSVVVQILSELGAELSQLFLVDSSPGMLSNSSSCDQGGAPALLADARTLPFAKDSMAWVCASLGDAFNDALFWCEMARVVRPGGRVLFTTPSPEWAHDFRSEQHESAEFRLASGERVLVPSTILSVEEQCSLMQKCGLVVQDVITSEAVPPLRSTKLETAHSLGWPIVITYVAGRAGADSRG